MSACRAMNCMQRDVLVKRNQRPAVSDSKRKQVEIRDLVVSVDACEIHRSIIAK